MRMQIAQTNVQLYNQLREKGLPLGDLIVVHRAYELLTTIYPGYFQADGKPFVAHGVGVASILAELDQPTEIVAAGLLHNVYGNGDFGDGRVRGATGARRGLVREAVGERIEHLVHVFSDVRIKPRAIEESRRALPLRNEDERRMIVVDLADHLEKHADLGVLYFARSDWLDSTGRVGGDLVEIAVELGEPRLAEMLASAFEEAAAERDQIPAELRPSDDRPHLRLIMPRSCRRRFSVTLRAAMRRLRVRLRPRTRLRRLVSAAGKRGRIAG